MGHAITRRALEHFSYYCEEEAAAGSKEDIEDVFSSDGLDHTLHVMEKQRG